MSRKIEFKMVPQKQVEREFLRELIIDYVREYFEENNLAINKLREQKLVFIGNQCTFLNLPNDAKMPKDISNQATLIIEHRNGELAIIETEYTRECLGLDG